MCILIIFIIKISNEQTQALVEYRLQRNQNCPKSSWKRLLEISTHRRYFVKRQSKLIFSGNSLFSEDRRLISNLKPEHPRYNLLNSESADMTKIAASSSIISRTRPYIFALSSCCCMRPIHAERYQVFPSKCFRFGGAFQILKNASYQNGIAASPRHAWCRLSAMRIFSWCLCQHHKQAPCSSSGSKKSVAERFTLKGYSIVWLRHEMISRPPLLACSLFRVMMLGASLNHMMKKLVNELGKLIEIKLFLFSREKPDERFCV